MAARRETFRRELARRGKISVLEALRASIQNLFSHRLKPLLVPAMRAMRTSLIVIILLLTVIIGSLHSSSPVTFQSKAPQLRLTFVSTTMSKATKVICRRGYSPPLCLAEPFDKNNDLTFQGNGLARPAVAKDTLPGYNGLYRAAYVNDGLYGPGTTWVSDSPNSWIKIDLGKATAINTIEFGKDRLGNSRGGDPGQFVIAVALSDNVYADGNSSNDYIEYTQVYDSKQTGFNGIIPGSETIQAQFAPVKARYIKITFANPRTAIDEVEAFMKQPTPTSYPTKRSKGNPPGTSATSIPTGMPRPTGTALPAPTGTPAPVTTATSVPTNTLAPTDTPIPATDTPLPALTDTPVPIPTDTPIPPPTDTPPPANTAVPPPTDTSAPPLVNLVQPTDTSVPPTVAAPMAVPTDTSLPAQS